MLLKGGLWSRLVALANVKDQRHLTTDSISDYILYEYEVDIKTIGTDLIFLHAVIFFFIHTNVMIVSVN